MAYHINIREEELKNKIAKDYFWLYDTSIIIGNVDFCVSIYDSENNILEQESLLWAEAKKGHSKIQHSLVQLILTIGKARTFDTYLPPNMLGAFDAEKMAFIPYNDIQHIFYMNDFNWNITPSNYETKEFKIVLEKVQHILDKNTFLFYYNTDDKELKKFIKTNFIVGKFGFTKTRIDKNNFIAIYGKWLQKVKPTIAVNWESLKKLGIIDGDFYLADLLSSENQTIKESLFVLLKKNIYELDRVMDNTGLFSSKQAEFSDDQKAHLEFWNKYERPPKEDYLDYIIQRRDLLVPQDIRERKGSFFTPQIWVELSQNYLKEMLGENWQEEYYIWDCAAGTGNLLNGLTNKYNIWASTIDKQDIDVIKDRIKNGANLLAEHVFQFDFLNDDFSKLPKTLKDVLNNSYERKKLIIYINPPYAEATTLTTVTKTGKNKAGVSTKNKANEFFKSKIGNASNEIFALFMAQVYDKLPDVILAQFSKLKFIQGTNFTKFKAFFLAKYKGGFVVPANSFDNVKGHFPIGFTVWDLNNKAEIKNIKCDVYHKEIKKIGKKTFYGKLPKSINKWIKLYENNEVKNIGYMGICGPDFQNNKFLHIQNNKGIRHVNYFGFVHHNIFNGFVYFAVRHCIAANWLNDRDQFLFPKKNWESDVEFRNDCLAFTLFHGQNRISSKEGTNHWIPFTENEVNAKAKFESNFMSNFIHGKLKPDNEIPHIFSELSEFKPSYQTALTFSKEAQAVFAAGRELWTYYHAKPNINVNAALYDIREFFQGRNQQTKMNTKSEDKYYTKLISELREELINLANKMEPKIYEYEFLKI